jgi:diguanylate cyclase (GGDEF)-like protein
MEKQQNPARVLVSGQPCAAMESASGKLDSLTSLFENLDVEHRSGPAAAHLASHRAPGEPFENRLVRARLGVASSLFFALRAKHPPTAAHSVRVALVASSWCSVLGLTDSQRDEIEVAALLHDIGKIGVPDRWIAAGSALSAEGNDVRISRSRHARLILADLCASPRLQDIIYYAAAAYDGQTEGFERGGEDLPLGARLLAIVNCFDELTNGLVGGRALSRQQAMAVLLDGVGTQFDPERVPQFGDFLQEDLGTLGQAVSQRWLKELTERQTQGFWRVSRAVPSQEAIVSDNLFHEQLLETMPNGVVYVDTRLSILKWSRVVRDLTGIESERVERRRWEPGLIGLRDENYKLITPERCPVTAAVNEGTSTSGRFLIADAIQEKIAVDMCVTPVLGPDGDVRGATVVMHDASSHVNLEERLVSLNEKASQDGLTGVANRAEFDRTHASWFQMHLERGLPYSLIICDLDFFKKINDTYGHQAGDEALIAFGALLRKYARSSDLVARYGGEEFVILCADCDGDSASVRAENIREALAEQRLPMLHGRCLTASYGVTACQSGDTAETMLRRADRALLQAKADGRNTVVQLGASKSGQTEQGRQRLGWLLWWKDGPGKHVLQRRVLTPVPLELAKEKIRGFVAERHAQTVKVGEDSLVLMIDGKHVPLMRRSGDRPTPLLMELSLEEVHLPSERRPGCKDLRTVVRVTIRPKRQRDRRRPDVDARARQLLADLKSYLMASY